MSTSETPNFAETPLNGLEPHEAVARVVQQAVQLQASDLFVLTDESAVSIAARTMGKMGQLASPGGLILVTGPTGTGKTTTLYACLQHLNTATRKINTIEDPVEYALPGIRQSQVNAKIGVDFADLLRNVLRQAPDVIMIG